VKLREEWNPLVVKTRSADCEVGSTRPASGGEGLALDGMANVSEPLKRVVTDSKLKVLTSLNQNGMWPGKDVCSLIFA
jgi:hypothetical protein